MLAWFLYLSLGDVASTCWLRAYGPLGMTEVDRDVVLIGVSTLCERVTRVVSPGFLRLGRTPILAVGG